MPMLFMVACGSRSLQRAIGNVAQEVLENIDESEIIAKLCNHLPNNSIMIDVGGHHGSALIFFHKMNWKIYAFEPDTQNRKFLND